LYKFKLQKSLFTFGNRLQPHQNLVQHIEVTMNAVMSCFCGSNGLGRLLKREIEDLGY